MIITITIFSETMILRDDDRTGVFLSRSTFYPTSDMGGLIGFRLSSLSDGCLPSVHQDPLRGAHPLGLSDRSQSCGILGK